MAAKGYTATFVRLRSRPGGRWLVDPELRSRLVVDAEREGVSLIDEVVAILAAKYGVPYASTPRKTTPARDGEELNLILPDRLHSKIAAACAKNHPQTVADAIRATLSAHYDLPLPAKSARGRSPVAP